MWFRSVGMGKNVRANSSIVIRRRVRITTEPLCIATAGAILRIAHPDIASKEGFMRNFLRNYCTPDSNIRGGAICERQSTKLLAH